MVRTESVKAKNVHSKFEEKAFVMICSKQNNIKTDVRVRRQWEKFTAHDPYSLPDSDHVNNIEM